jgi:hypothetical protein
MINETVQELLEVSELRKVKNSYPHPMMYIANLLPNRRSLAAHRMLAKEKATSAVQQ